MPEHDPTMVHDEVIVEQPVEGKVAERPVQDVVVVERPVNDAVVERPVERAGISWRSIVRLTLVAAAMLGVATVLWFAADALTPFIISLVIAYLMLPAVNRLSRRIPRWAAILVMYVVTFGSLGIALSYVIPPAVTQISQFVEGIPGWYENSRDDVERLIARFRREAPPEVEQRVEEQIARIQQTVEDNATAYSQRVAGFLFNSVVRVFQTLTFLIGFLVIPFFLFYVLLDSQRLPRTIDSMLHPRIRADFWNILRIVDTVMGKYIRGQLTLGLIVALMSFVGLVGLNAAGFNVEFTVLLALIAGVGELIPVVGPILSAIPAVIVGATDGWRTALAVAALYAVIQQVENQVLVPRIVGNTLKLHAAFLMALLVIASQIGGLPLVILSAPLAAIARDIFLYAHRRLEEPPVAPGLAIAQVMGEERTEDGKAI